jgi:uncharacterized circularly permuted ATP-grasp superfamily protein
MTNSSLSSYDEMLDADGATRPAYSGYCEWLKEQPPELLRRKSGEAEAFFRKTGITFNVYGNEDAEERLIPFDMVPRIINAAQWRRLSRGIEQRVRALNAFLHDLYHRQEIVRSGRLPERVLKGNKAFLPQMAGFTPPGGVYTHIVGIDLVRTGEDDFMVLEDNARTPSGVSYMLENRETMMAMFPNCSPRCGCARCRTIPAAWPAAWPPAPRRPPTGTSRWSPCSRRARSIPPITNTPSWPTRWAPNWWKAAT